MERPLKSPMRIEAAVPVTKNEWNSAIVVELTLSLCVHRVFSWGRQFERQAKEMRQ